MSGAGVRIVGLLRVKEAVSEERLDAALKKVTLLVERHAKEYCPVRTGRLRASIHHGKLGDLTYYVGSNVEYAVFVEFGTYKMAAKPYLRPAMKRAVAEVSGKVFEGVM